MVPFEELFSLPLRNGVNYPSKLRGSGVSMINMKEIFAFDRISDQPCERAPITASERTTHLLEDGDLLFARQSLTFEGAGKCSLVLTAEGERTWESHLIRVRLNKLRAVPEYYYYYFRSPTGRRSIEAIVQQVAAAGIRGSDLRRLQVPAAKLWEQRAIADVLGALDDKIAANTRLASTADELATAEFRRAVAGVEFSTRTFAEVALVNGGGTPSTKIPEYWDGGVPWASPTDITKLSGPYLFQTSRTITPDGLASCASQLYPVGSILMTSRATIGAFALAEVPVAVNQGFIVVVPPDDCSRYWLFHDMRDRVDEFLTHANGATFLELSRGNFRRLPARLADRTTMESFSRAAEALHTCASAALRQNITLAATRDALLPVLMSGALRVRDAERIVTTSV